MDFLKKLGSGLVEEATEKLQTTLTEGASDAMSSLTGSVTKSLLGKAAGTLKPRSRAAFSQPSACHIFLVRSGAAENVMESLSPQIDEAFNGARDNAKQELGAKLRPASSRPASQRLSELRARICARHHLPALPAQTQAPRSTDPASVAPSPPCIVIAAE